MKWFHENGESKGSIPTKCVEECSHSGSCDADVERWVAKMKFVVPREKAVKYLKEFGAWSEEELNAKSDKELAETVLWVACGQTWDGLTWDGLIH